MPQNSLEPILRHLEKNAPSADKCVACAALMALFRTPGPLMLDNLDGICEKLLNIISSTDEADEVVKPNAIGALSTGFEVSEQMRREGINGGAAEKLAALVTTTDSTIEIGRQIVSNALVGIGALGETSADGLQAVLATGGLPAAIMYCSPNVDIYLQIAAVDALCRCMTADPTVIEIAEKLDVIPAMASVISSSNTRTEKGREVIVRALCGLAMIGMQGEESMVKLASSPGVVPALLVLMRQGDDADTQRIATGMFQELARCPASKEAVAAGMREAQQKERETTKYIGDK